MKKILMSFGIALLVISILWTLIFWHNSVNGVTTSCAGKGICEKSLFYCSSFKGFTVACSFFEAFREYALWTRLAIALLPQTLITPNLFSTVFYGTAGISFYFYKSERINE